MSGEMEAENGLEYAEEELDPNMITVSVADDDHAVSEGEDDDDRVGSRVSDYTPSGDEVENEINEELEAQEEAEPTPKPTLSKSTGARFEELLAQTAKWSHILDTGDSKAKKSRAKKLPSTANQADHRHRQTEDQEDKRLLAEETEKEGNVWFTESPAFVTGGKMRDYQIRGLNWLISIMGNGINGILADEMGLGKTLQTISLLTYMKLYKNSRPHLVIVPQSTLYNWMNEINKFCPELKAFMLYAKKDTREAVKQSWISNFNSLDVCVTSYEMLMIEKVFFRKFSWEYVVIDEAHRIKNDKSKVRGGRWFRLCWSRFSTALRSRENPKIPLPTAANRNTAAKQPARALGFVEFPPTGCVLFLRRFRRLVQHERMSRRRHSRHSLAYDSQAVPPTPIKTRSGERFPAQARAESLCRSLADAEGMVPQDLGQGLRRFKRRRRQTASGEYSHAIAQSGESPVFIPRCRTRPTLHHRPAFG